MRYLCDIIVLTWNQKEIIKSFVESLLRTTYLPSQLIIIDNASIDGTREYLESLRSTDQFKVKIILNNENRGFVGGMNQGLTVSSAPYVCLANNDLIFTKGWLSEIISIFEKHPKVGVLNPHSNNLGANPPKGVSLEEFAQQLKARYTGVFVEMPFCIGFCMVIKREVIEKIGGLSEEFHPMFFEDTDYSMKAKSAGYLIGVAKGSYVWHQEHASFKQWPKEKEEVFAKSREKFTKKWGKILRVAWIVEDFKELLDNLDRGINLAREGNFVRFFVKNLHKEREAIFKESNHFEHSGIEFIKFNNLFDLVFKILKKKKRYNLIISKSRSLHWLLDKFKYPVLTDFDEEKIREIKHFAYYG